MLARRRRRHALGVGNGKADVIPKPNKSPKKPAPRNYLKTPYDVIPSDRRESRDLAGSALLDLFGEIYFVSRLRLVSPLASLGRNDKKRVLR